MLLRSVEIVSGLYYLVFGIDGFVKRIPLPLPSERALAFLKALDESRYLLFTVKVIEIIVGLCWILGVGGGLAWLVFTPIWFNILAYHWFLNRQEIFLPSMIFVLHILLAIHHKEFLFGVWRSGISVSTIVGF
jgi:hypothetical protein